MAKHGKKYREVVKLVEKTKHYTPAEAIALAKKTTFVKFDPTLELHVVLNLDPNKADQQLRGTITLPHGTGKKQRILVFAKGEKELEAKKAGADHVGNTDLIEKIKGGWFEFDVAVATPDMMAEVGKIAKIIGTKGLMPNPKSGTVTMDIEKTIEALKKGRVEYRLEKQPIVHTFFGKASFTDAQLVDNLRALVDAILRAKPRGAKGQYLKSAALNASMGPGIALDVSALIDITKSKD
ncbi:MAG: 50S ribosomal protein L1 [bacterium]